MTDTLLVVLGGVIAGTLERLSGGRLRFDYTEEYQDQPGATSISLSMPLQVRSHSDRTITPWLWGLLPDNDAVLARWARHFHVAPSSPFSLLATQIGEDCAGAVRFAPLRRVIKCHVCGSSLTGSWSKDRKLRYASYRCPKRGCGGWRQRAES